MMALHSTHPAVILFLLCVASCILWTSSVLRTNCIRFETYQVTVYNIRPFQISNNWFSHRRHYSPLRTTRTALRSRRVLGCCDPGYEHRSDNFFDCQPICSQPCPANSTCTAPEKCSCFPRLVMAPNRTCVPDDGMTKFLSHAVEYTTHSATNLTTEMTETTTISTTTPTSCDHSCSTNEECSVPDNTCVCKSGYYRFTSTTSTPTSSNCVPKCEPECQHADCTEPNVCTCWPHYIPSNDTFCHFECTQTSCSYGECDANGQCVCAPSFIHNGRACVWNGDAISLEPVDCNCWKRYSWLRNDTIEDSTCLTQCDTDRSANVTSECLNLKQCRHFEQFSICDEQFYKCYPSDVNEQSTIGYTAQQVSHDSNDSMQMTVLIIAFLGAILLIGGALLLWQKERACLRNLWNYNRMENPREL